METFGEAYERLLKHYNALEVPQCVLCESSDTATVQCGVIRLTMALSSKCRKFKLVGNGPKPAAWYCNKCEKFFNEDGSEPLPEDTEHEPQNVEECIQAMKKHGGFTMNIGEFFSS